MLLSETESSHKDRNQNVIYIALGMIALTVADSVFNPNVDKILIFYSCLILILICFLGLIFLSRQSHRHFEYHKRKRAFLTSKLTEDDFKSVKISAKVKKIIETEYLDKIKDKESVDIEELTHDIFVKYGNDINNVLGQYQNKYHLELLKIKYKTLTEKFDWEYFGLTRAWVDFIIIDCGRNILLLIWSILFIYANLNLIV